MLVVLSLIIAMALHLLLGWEWTILAGIVAGYFGARFGALQGMLAVGLSWTLLLFWNFIVAINASSKLLAFFGEFLGGLSNPLVGAIVIGLGCVLGLLGGLIGSRLRIIFSRAPDKGALV